MTATSDAFEIISSGSEEIIVAKDLQERLASGEKLRVKLGVDPTSADLHLGHTVVINKLKQFQDLGHEVLFLVGDFTAMIGDPSGRRETRPKLTRQEVLENAKTYQKQVGRILDAKKIKIVFNSHWLAKMTPYDIAEILSKYTVARVLERLIHGLLEGLRVAHDPTYDLVGLLSRAVRARQHLLPHLTTRGRFDYEVVMSVL